MPLINLGDETIYYARQGSESGRSVVLVHAAGGSHLDWPAQLRRITGARVYTIDLPGHGRSSGQPRDSIQDYAAVLKEFLEVLQLRQIALIGHSMGGAIVQSIALSLPSEVIGLVLISTGAQLKISDTFLDNLNLDRESTIEILLNSVWGANVAVEQRMRGSRTLLSQPSSVLRADYRACDGFDLMDRVGEIRLPTLIICGTNDQLTPLEYSQYLAKQIPNARLRTFKGAGHMVTLERSDEVAQTTNSFLDELW